MNCGLPEMMMIHCLNSSGSVAVTGNNGPEMTVLERQRARMKWQQQLQQNQQQQGFDQYGVYSVMDQGSEGASVSQFQAAQMCRDGAGLHQEVKPDPGFDGGWAGFGSYAMPGVGDGLMSCGYVNDGVRADQPGYQMMDTVSYPGPVVGDVSEAKDSILTDKMSLGGAAAAAAAKEGSKKRKAEKASSPKATAESDTKEKKIKEWSEDGESKITQQNKSNNSKNKSKGEASGDTSKDNSKVSEVKTDYIHVRARRGQATDSHSLAERVRREKISERMKYLQDLVPGCNKITGKAGMLDEIINYVQSLQRQVEFLSMKLATVNPQISFSIDNLFGKEVFAPCTLSYPTLSELSQMANSAYVQYSHLEEALSPGLDLGSYQPDMGLQRPTPETYVETPSFIQMQPNPSTWDADLQNLLTMDFQGRSASFPLQPFTGSTEVINLKMEI